MSRPISILTPLFVAIFASSAILFAACGMASVTPPGTSSTVDSSSPVPNGADAGSPAVTDGGAAESDGCAPSAAGGVGSNDAGYGCGDAGIAGFCDNGVRQEAPTCDPTVDALLARAPLACASKNSKHAYKLDTDSADPDSVAGRMADMCNLKGAIYWVADMDIDCDGKRTAECPGSGANADPSWQGNTFVQANGGPLTSAKDPYVVIPNDNYKGVTNGAVVAVIYGKKLVYAVFGDTGPPGIIGEGSYALAKALGVPPSPANGGVLGNTVTYIAFTGSGAVPSDLEDQSAVDALGKSLTQALITNNP